MKDKNNEQIVFEMLEEVATESIAEARNAYTYDEIDDCYVEAKKIAEVAKMELENKTKQKYKDENTFKNDCKHQSCSF